MTPDPRTHWRAEGVTDAELLVLESLAPLDQWDIQWQSHLGKDDRHRRAPDEQGPGQGPGEFLTRVRCPKCGLESTYALDVVTDFHCDDDQACGYDYLEDDEGLKPLPGSW